MKIYHKTLADTTGSGYRRSIWPQEHLLERKSQVVFQHGMFISEKFNKFMTGVIFHRMGTEEQFKLWKQIRKRKNLEIIYEIDDNAWEIPPSNERAYNFFVKKTLNNMKAMMKKSDKVILNSKFLCDYVRNVLDVDVPIELVHNHLPDNVWEYYGPNMSFPDEKPRILFATSYSYKPEIEWLFELIKRTKGKYTWIVTGEEYTKKIFNGKEKEYDIETSKFAPPCKYQNMLRRARPYIGVVPKLDNIFNKCRGSTKALEYTSLGIPAIGTKHDTWEEDTSVIKCPLDYDVWEAEIDKLISDKAYYIDTVKAQQLILNDRWLSTGGIKEWEAALL